MTWHLQMKIFLNKQNSIEIIHILRKLLILILSNNVTYGEIIMIFSYDIVTKIKYLSFST